MEVIKKLNSNLDEIEQDVASVKDAIYKLNAKFVEEANHIRRMDRISALEELKERLFTEIEKISNDEITAKNNFNRSNCLGGVIGFGVDTFVALAKKKEKPILAGLNTFMKKTSAVAPFGNTVAIFKENINLADIEIISVSQIARERRITEAMVIAGYKNNGYTVLTPEKLKQHLDKLIEDTKNNTPTIYLKRRLVAVQPVK